MTLWPVWRLGRLGHVLTTLYIRLRARRRRRVRDGGRMGLRLPGPCQLPSLGVANGVVRGANGNSPRERELSFGGSWTLPTDRVLTRLERKYSLVLAHLACLGRASLLVSRGRSHISARGPSRTRSS